MGTPIGGSGEGFLSSAGTVLSKSNFTDVVVPAMQTSCNTCHSATGSATATIYNYAFAKSRLSGGVDSYDNSFINKINGKSAHIGNTICQSETASPCKEIAKWSVIENPMLSKIPVGFVERVSSSGVVTGWAIDPKNPAAKISVSIYGNTSFAAGGTLAVSATADGNGPNSKYAGHYFTAQLPRPLVDAVQRDIFVYAGATNPDALFIASPTSFKAYGPTVDGENYFNTTLMGGANRLSSCTACHNNTTAVAFNYAIAFDLLISPFPDNKGTNVNNGFISKPLGGAGHFKACASSNVEPCLSIKTWWDTEFGP